VPKPDPRWKPPAPRLSGILSLHASSSGLAFALGAHAVCSGSNPLVAFLAFKPKIADDQRFLVAALQNVPLLEREEASCEGPNVAASVPPK
jgi:hypothetical protein